MKKTKIEDICDILNGFAFKSDKYVKKGIRVIRIANVQKGYIEDNAPVFYPTDFSGMERYMLREGDLLMSLTGNVGRVALIQKEMLPAALNQRVACLRINSDRITKKYLYHILNSDFFEQQCMQASNGVAQKNISTEWLRKYEIPLCSIDEQLKVTEILDGIQNVIDSKIAELKGLDDLVRGRFVEMFGNPIVNEKRWAVVELNSVCDGIGDGLHGTPEYDEKGRYPFINGNNLMNGAIEVTPATKMVDEATYKRHFIELSNNAILLSINGTLGKLAFYNGEEVMLGKSACYCNLKPCINRDFVYGVMKTDAFTGFLESNSTASTIKNVGLKAIRGFMLIMPPEELQTRYVEFAKQVDKSKFRGLSMLTTMKSAYEQQTFIYP